MNIFQAVWSKIPKNWLDIIQNYYHVPIALLVFGVTSTYTMKTGHDLGANYVASLYALYGFLGAHFTASQIWPDKPGDKL